MPETFGDLLVDAETRVEPREGFIENLSAELAAVVDNTPTSKRPRRLAFGLLGSAVAAALAMVIGFAVSVDDPSLEPVESDVVAEPASLPMGVARACDRFVFGFAVTPRVASVGPASVRQLAGVPSVSAIHLDDLRGVLGELASLYGATPNANPAAMEGLSSAIKDFGLASLFLKMGEPFEAQRHLDQARAVLGGLTEIPALGTCFGL